MTQTTRIGTQNNPSLLRDADLGQPQTVPGYRDITAGFRSIIASLGWDKAAAIAALITARYTAIAAVPVRLGAVPPAINNVVSAQVGKKLSLMLPKYDGVPAPVLTFQWVSGASTNRATTADYTPVVGDVGATLKCTITATNSGGNISETTAVTNLVLA